MAGIGSGSHRRDEVEVFPQERIAKIRTLAGAGNRGFTAGKTALVTLETTMFDLTRHSRLLKMLSWLDRIKDFFRRRYAKGRKAEKNLHAFYGRIWREAAAPGGEYQSLGNNVYEIRLGEAQTRVVQNSTGMDDLGTHTVVRTKPVIYRLFQFHGLPTPRFVGL